ncbi:3-methyladenine DNA glycosylase [Nitratifractor salsuginis]|uniref:HhH-GPD family protein n=1 Tax=Nitratifractor salsuginis (strain DSM 16511 / JCM 12458 / E9I37-1) TaxID=749222 RepID=E6WZJ6_NITSE|nr:3-methyladenine DNA glycosylase [Nitratifractor salsuginis]ADV45576.1 HhH-GPD family protein [Nitratifractor salsuginis DSM 16511]
MIDNSFELLFRLKSVGYDNPSRDPWWWPNSGSFEVVVGGILTQNANWERVELSLENLRNKGLLNPESLAEYPAASLEALIRPSGFHTAKGRNLRELSRAMLEKFGSFDAFRQEVSREWLLERRGVGPETADAILNYACYREAFVVDSYTARLLAALGYELESYDAVQSWMLEGLAGREKELFAGMPAAQIYARSHGMVVEYCKANRKGRQIRVEALRD